MNKWLNQFLTDFHKTHLKKFGFSKVRHTFSRDMGKYWERFNFQSEAWNSAGNKYWKFYLNVGIEFKDLEPQKPWLYLSHTHWADRIKTVNPDAPYCWNYNLDTDREALMRELEAQILKASAKMANETAGLKRHYLKGKRLERYSFAEI